jgi:topoisomerase-4 subunit B
MYTRTENPLHIIQEVIDNAADEALAGHCSRIEVSLQTDGSITVVDDGRGIPVGLHPQEKAPVAELVFTRLHAGGKFDKHAAAGAYAFSGGLHGVGVSVTNALSKHLALTVWRDGGQYEMAFAGGEVVAPLKKVGEVPKKRTGTSVTLVPDPKYFDSATLPLAELTHLLRSKAVLLAGVTVVLNVQKSGEQQTWCYEDGLQGYLSDALSETGLLVPLFAGQQYAQEGDDQFASGEGAQWVVAWVDDGPVIRESYVNLIPTPAGGTHEAGLREGLFGAVKGFAELHNLLPKGIKLLPEDVFSKVSFVLSAKVLDPQFQGQIKERLNSRDAVRLVGGFVKTSLELWLNTHVEFGRKLADLAIRQAQARTRAAQKIEKKRGSGVAVLPGKLTDCESSDSSRTEIFLVEGDSAGGSAKMGRDKAFQAILPLRGKVLNSWEVDKDRLFANNEIHDIAVAIGVDPHGPDDNPDLSQLRYGRICILSDADVDGSHIQVLLLTLFFKHFSKVVEAGHLYVARPPLFRVDVPAQGKRPLRKFYCLDQGELEALLDKLRKEGVREDAWSIGRFKGLGEMSPEQLWETTLNPDTRRMLRAEYGELGLEQTRLMFNMLMGKGESGQRRQWIEDKGNLAQVDI